jgi:hypothetical protein
MAGQLANDLNILTKLTTIAFNPVGGHEIFARANAATGMLMLKLLAGKINEGWLLIGQQFSPLYKKYEGELSDEAKVALDYLKKYFGKSNVVNIIRNKVGFHSDMQIIQKGYEFFPTTEIFVDYLTESQGHSLYYSAEIISAVGITHLIDEHDWRAGIDKITLEIGEIAVKMVVFFLEYMKAFVQRYIAHGVTDIHKDKFTIADGPPIDTVTIPFFCVVS